MAEKIELVTRDIGCECGVKSLRNVLLVNINRLKKESYIDDNVSENTLRTAVIYVQDLIVERVIGTSLFDRLRELVAENVIHDFDYRRYKWLVDDYLFPIFVYGVQAEISVPLSYKNRNAGTVQSLSEDKTNASLSDIKFLNQYFSNKKDFYVKRAIDFLRCKSSDYEELKHCRCAWCHQQAGNPDPSNPLNLKNERSFFDRQWRNEKW